MAGKPAAALTFDGKQDAVALGPAGALRLTRCSFTAEAWVRMAASDQNELPIFGTDETAKDFGLHLVLRNRIPYFGFYKNDTPGRTRLAVDAWVHLAFRYNLEGGAQAIFVNGELDSSSGGHGPFQGEGIVHLGQWAGKFRFQGEMTEARVWSRALSNGEIAAGMFRRATGAEPGLVACWPLDDGSGKQARILRPVQQAKLEGGAGWAKEPGDGFVRPGGKIANLPRSGDPGAHILIPHGPDIDVTRKDDFTVELWVAAKVESQHHRQRWVSLIGKRPETGAFPFSIWMDKAGTLLVERSDGSQAVRFTSGRTIGDGQLHHVGLAKVGPDLILYIDGVRDAMGPDSSRGRVGNTEPLRIGYGSGTSDFLVGHVCEVRFWEYGRSAEEIRAAAAVRLAGNETGLAGYWPLDDGEGETGRDGKLLPPATLAGPSPKWMSDTKVPLLARDLEELPTAPALEFGGDGGNMTARDARALNFPNGLSVEAWVRPGEAPGPIYRFPVVSSHGSASGFELRCSRQTASMMVTLNRVHHEVPMADAPEPGRWIHLAGTWDGKLVALYVNGVLKASRAVSGTYTVYPGELRIGQNSFWTDRAFTGAVAEVRLWDRGLTPDEVLGGVYGRLNPATAKGLRAYWPLNEYQGETANATDKDGKFAGKLWRAKWVGAELPPRIPELEGAPARSASVKADASQWSTRIQQLEDELKKSEEKSYSLELQQKQAAEQLAQLRAEKQNLERRLAKLDDVEQELESRRKELEDLKSQVESGRQLGEVSLATLIRNTNREIEEARSELVARGGAYRLGRVTMELRMLPGPGGAGAIFPSTDAMETLGSDQLSKLNLDFDTERPPAPPEAPKTEVPDVLGQSETLARRKLAEAGFLVKTAFQAVSETNAGISQVGRVVSQLPQPGDQVVPHTTVRIFVGQKS